MSQGNHVSLAFAPKDSWKQVSFVYLFFSNLNHSSSGGSEDFCRNEVLAFKA